MNRYQLLLVLPALSLALTIGCQKIKGPPSGAGGPPKASVPQPQSNLAGLRSEDIPLAEAQGRCPVTDEELGSMGVPVKVLVKDEAVFVCCKGCIKDVEADPEGTLKKVAELKAKKSAK